MTRGAYMSPLGSSDPLLPDKCFRWAPCPPWLCKCTSGARDYINNSGGIWQGACLSANDASLISISYEILQGPKSNPVSWGPISTYCCVSDPSNKLSTTLNLIDMICPYIGISYGNTYDWYNITPSLETIQHENSGNISDASVGLVFTSFGYSSYKIKMSCKGISNERGDFCTTYKDGSGHSGAVPPAPPTPAPINYNYCASYNEISCNLPCPEGVPCPGGFTCWKDVNTCPTPPTPPTPTPPTPKPTCPGTNGPCSCGTNTCGAGCRCGTYNTSDYYCWSKTNPGVTWCPSP